MEFTEVTEQPSLCDNLDKKLVKGTLKDIDTEDRKVADAIQKAALQVEGLATLIIPQVEKGGRISCMGVGTSGRLGVLDTFEMPLTFGILPVVTIGLIVGRGAALYNPTENAEDGISRG